MATCDKATKIATIGLLSHIRTKNAQKFFGATIIVKLPREISVKLSRCFAIIQIYMVYHTPLIARLIIIIASLIVKIRP